MNRTQQVRSLFRHNNLTTRFIRSCPDAFLQQMKFSQLYWNWSNFHFFLGHFKEQLAGWQPDRFHSRFKTRYWSCCHIRESGQTRSGLTIRNLACSTSIYTAEVENILSYEYDRLQPVYITLPSKMSTHSWVSLLQRQQWSPVSSPAQNTPRHEN